MFRKVGLALIIFLCFAPASGANAQLVTCGKILLEYFGKPLAAELARQAGGKIADYFSKKLEHGSQEFTRDDVDALGRQGVTPCQLREAITGPLPNGNNYQQGFSAQAHCSVTGATGYSYNLPTPQMAMQTAINNCIYYGGIPQCCANGAMMAP